MAVNLKQLSHRLNYNKTRFDNEEQWLKQSLLSSAITHPEIEKKESYATRVLHFPFYLQRVQ
jgi:hypothetical protein